MSTRLTKELVTSLQQLQNEHMNSEALIHRLNQIHESILEEQQQTLAVDPLNPNDKRIDPNQEYRMHAADFELLKNLYMDTSKQLEHEENLIVLILAKLQDLIDKAEEAKHQKSTASTSPPPAEKQRPTAHRISSRAYITGEKDVDSLQPDEKVAARVSLQTEDEESDFWILARVKGYLGKDKIEVIDADPGDEDGHPVLKTYKLHKRHILPLAQDIKDHKPYKKGTVVLAVFPNTTTFYRATVEQPPSRTTPKEYLLKFEDDEDEETGKTPSRRVKFNYVVAPPR